MLNKTLAKVLFIVLAITIFAVVSVMIYNYTTGLANEALANRPNMTW